MNDVVNWAAFFGWLAIALRFGAVYVKRNLQDKGAETYYVGWAVFLLFTWALHYTAGLTNSVTDAGLGWLVVIALFGVSGMMTFVINRTKERRRRKKEEMRQLGLDLPRVSVILVTESMSNVEFMNRMYSVQQQTYPKECLDTLIIMSHDENLGEQVWSPEEGARWGVERASTDLVAVVSPGEQWPPSMLARLVGYFREEDSGDSVTLEGFMNKDFGVAGSDPHQKVKATLCTRDYYMEHVS